MEHPPTQQGPDNFVFSFDGCIPFDVIQSYEQLLLEPFYGSGQLCPSMGWTRFVVHGVPTWDGESFEFFGPGEILEEVRMMPGLKKAVFAMQPRWLRPVSSIEKDYSSITFAVSDPDGVTTNALLNGRSALFGKEVTVRKWVDKPALVQCSRCHALGHNKSSRACALSKDSVKCYICGGAHSAENHDKQCHRRHETAGQCDCTHFKCLNCHKTGHNCRDTRCTARDQYQPRGTGNRKSDRGWKGKARAMNPAEIPILDEDEDLYAPIAGPSEQQRPRWTQEDLDRMDAMECEQDTQGYFHIPDDSIPSAHPGVHPPPAKHAAPTPEANPGGQPPQMNIYSPSHPTGVANQTNHA